MHGDRPPGDDGMTKKLDFDDEAKRFYRIAVAEYLNICGDLRKVVWRKYRIARAIEALEQLTGLSAKEPR